MRLSRFISNCDFPATSANYEKFLVVPPEYKLNMNMGYLLNDVRVVPLCFEDVAKAMEFKSFTQAFNNRYVYCNNSHLVMQPMKLGKSNLIYANRLCCFSEEKEPLYIRLFTAPQNNNNSIMTIIMSPKVLFSDNVWLTNMMRKVFSYSYYNCSAKIIIDESLLNSCFVNPSVPKHLLSISNDVKKFFQNNDIMEYALSGLS